MVFLYITCPTKDEARQIAEKVIGERSAGCANVFPVRSLYQEDGSLQATDEVAMIVQTIETKIGDVTAAVRGIHSGKKPCIASFALYRVNDEYKNLLAARVG